MKFEHKRVGFERVVNPSNDGKGWDVRKKVKLFLVEDGLELEQVSAEASFDDMMQPKVTVRENRMEIGAGEYYQQSDGSVDLTLTVVGDTTMKSNNVPGMTVLKIFIPAALRKD